MHAIQKLPRLHACDSNLPQSQSYATPPVHSHNTSNACVPAGRNRLAHRGGRAIRARSSLLSWDDVSRGMGTGGIASLSAYWHNITFEKEGPPSFSIYVVLTTYGSHSHGVTSVNHENPLGVFYGPRDLSQIAASPPLLQPDSRRMAVTITHDQTDEHLLQGFLRAPS